VPVVLPLNNGGAFVKRIRFAVPISRMGTTQARDDGGG